MFKKGIDVLRQNPLKLNSKIKNVLNSISSIGYSSVGFDLERKKYFVAFGQYANHCSKITVPKGMVYEIDVEDKIEKKRTALYSSAGIAAISINGCKGAIKHCENDTNTSLIIGGGLLGVIAYYFMKEKGYSTNIIDPNKLSLSNQIPINSNINISDYSIIIDTTGSSKALEMYLENIKSYSSICLLGESDIPQCKQELESKNSVVTFCNSFGSDRGVVDVEYDLFSLDGYPKYRSMKSNINDACELIRKGKLDELIPLIKLHNPMTTNFEYCTSNLNIIDWTLR